MNVLWAALGNSREEKLPITHETEPGSGWVLIIDWKEEQEQATGNTAFTYVKM